MIRQLVCVSLVAIAVGAVAQTPTARPKFDAFEVATIKPVESGAKASRYITMQGTNRFVEKD